MPAGPTSVRALFVPRGTQMPQLVIGGVEVKVMEFRQLEDEQGDGDWRRSQYSVRLTLTDATEALAVRNEVQASVARAYRRSVNGDLRGGPLVSANGDLLGGGATFGIEIGEQPTEVTRWLTPEYYRTLALTLREA